MMMGRLIAIAIMIIPVLIMATVAKGIMSSMLATLGAGILTNFETALALSIPYLILVYCAIYRPIVKFWETIQGKQPPASNEE